MPIKLHFLSSFIPKKKSFSQGRRGEWKDLSFGHIISSHHLQRELEGNKHFTFINFINLLLFSKRQQQVARIEAWSSRKFLFYYCRRQKLPIGSEIRLLCQRAQDDCRVHIYWHQSLYILMVGGFTWNLSWKQMSVWLKQSMLDPLSNLLARTVFCFPPQLCANVYVKGMLNFHIFL